MPNPAQSPTDRTPISAAESKTSTARRRTAPRAEVAPGFPAVIVVCVFPGKMPALFTRRCPSPDRSSFLFGPRGTGKSTWIRTAIRADVSYDLLDAGESIRLAADPGLLARETAHVTAGGWVAPSRHSSTMNCVRISNTADWGIRSFSGARPTAWKSTSSAKRLTATRLSK